MLQSLAAFAAALARPTLSLCRSALLLYTRAVACVRQVICSCDGMALTERVTTLLPAERRMEPTSFGRGGVRILSLSCCLVSPWEENERNMASMNALMRMELFLELFVFDTSTKSTCVK